MTMWNMYFKETNTSVCIHMVSYKWPTLVWHATRLETTHPPNIKTLSHTHRHRHIPHLRFSPDPTCRIGTIPGHLAALAPAEPRPTSQLLGVNSHGSAWTPALQLGQTPPGYEGGGWGQRRGGDSAHGQRRCEKLQTWKLCVTTTNRTRMCVHPYIKVNKQICTRQFHSCLYIRLNKNQRSHSFKWKVTFSQPLPVIKQTTNNYKWTESWL